MGGSLRIRAQNILGHRNSEGFVCYSSRVGRCRLKNVTIANQGLERDSKQPLWKGDCKRVESCAITLRGDSEFIAENVVLPGNMSIAVEDGTRVIAQREGEKVVLHTEKLNSS